MEPRILTVRSDSPVEWLISDLAEDGYSEPDEFCSLHTSDQSDYFQIINNRLYTKSSVSDLQGQSVAIVVETAAPQRMFILNVTVAGNSTPHFSAAIYRAAVRNDVTPEMAIPIEPEITVVNVSESLDLHISIISNSTNLPFLLMHKKRRDTHYAKLYVSRIMRPTDETFQSFYIGALDKRNLVRLAVSRIDISFEPLPASVPKFSSINYFKQVDRLPPHVTVLRVTAKTTKGAVMYRIEPENVSFDVTPFSGDLFSRHGVPNGKYFFNVVATDSFGQKAHANVRILVGPRIDPKRQFKRLKTKSKSNYQVLPNENSRRSRRDFGNDIVLTLKENHPIGLLEKAINLRPNENVVFAPATTDYLRIHSNGSIELIKPLNYELEMSHQAAVQISGPFKG
uniref:Cadherin domain-containing protein n=1 Tax=Setaria digitata TaxID=48799 RepID=A0A915Q850_9BILA